MTAVLRSRLMAKMGSGLKGEGGGGDASNKKGQSLPAGSLFGGDSAAQGKSARHEHEEKLREELKAAQAARRSGSAATEATTTAAPD